MARPLDPNRLRQISLAALRAFSETGYSRTQVADIARLAGVAAGTIYLYAPSKEALFWMALQQALGETPTPQLHGSPEDREKLLIRVRDRLAPEGLSPSLWAVLDVPYADFPPLMTVLSEIWDAMERSVPATRLIERCAADWPELRSAYNAELRVDVLQGLAKYLERGVYQGVTRRVRHSTLAVRFILDTIGRYVGVTPTGTDPISRDPEAVKASVLDALNHAYCAPP